MLKNLNKGISTPLAIGIIVIVVVFVGGIFYWQWLRVEETEAPTGKGPEEMLSSPSSVKEEEETTEKPLEDVGEPALNLTTTKLATIPEEYDYVGLPSFGPNGKRVAYKAEKGGKEFVVIGNKEGKKYDSVDSFFVTFSPNGKDIAYVARQGNREFVVINSKESKAYDFVSEPVFSPDSSKLAYVATQGEKEFVVIDGKEKKRYQAVFDPLVFSPDGKKIAYKAAAYNKQGRGKYFIVVDDKEGKKYDLIENPRFSPDGQKLAYIAREDQRAFVVINGKEGEKYDSIGDFSFSPDSKELVYSATKGDSSFVIVRNENGSKSYDLNYSSSQFIFSPDGKKLIFEGREDNKCFIVVGKKEKGKYEWKKNKEYRYVKGNSRSELYDFCIGNITISENGQKIAYNVADADKGFLVVVQDEDGTVYYERKAQPLYSDPVISPDGQTVAYLMTGGKRTLVIGDRETKKYDHITKIVFSSDSKYIAYGVKDDDELWWIVEGVK